MTYYTPTLQKMLFLLRLFCLVSSHNILVTLYNTVYLLTLVNVLTNTNNAFVTLFINENTVVHCLLLMLHVNKLVILIMH